MVRVCSHIFMYIAVGIRLPGTPGVLNRWSMDFNSGVHGVAVSF